MLLIACGDFRTRDLINEDMRTIFAEKQYEPHRGEADYSFDEMVARRNIAQWYLFSLPHLGKELAGIYGCATAFAVSLYGHLSGVNLDNASYSILIGILVLNEIITVWWRIDRYLRLKRSDPAQPITAEHVRRISES